MEQLLFLVALNQGAVLDNRPGYSFEFLFLQNNSLLLFFYLSHAR